MGKKLLLYHTQEGGSFNLKSEIDVPEPDKKMAPALSKNPGLRAAPATLNHRVKGSLPWFLISTLYPNFDNFVYILAPNFDTPLKVINTAP